jgi:hypothetical protein
MNERMRDTHMLLLIASVLCSSIALIHKYQKPNAADRTYFNTKIQVSEGARRA